MREFTIGSLDRRQLRVRLFTPLSWHSPMRDPLQFFGKRWQHGSQRCYCPEGRISDVQVGFCGFMMTLSYSHYWGPVPCVCDEVIERVFASR